VYLPFIGGWLLTAGITVRGITEQETDHRVPTEYRVMNNQENNIAYITQQQMLKSRNNIGTVLCVLWRNKRLFILYPVPTVLYYVRRIPSQCWRPFGPEFFTQN
jgi:hypothetical protein